MMDINYRLDKFIEKVETAAWKLSNQRYDSGKDPFPRDDLYPAKPIRSYLAFMNPAPEWTGSLLKLKANDVALALLNNADDLAAIEAITKLFKGDK